ncbi:hypothetical protein ACIF8T_34530 [Streptomyces sp. NPDC085946]|uniref:hypothetical protein n=1 Tax=Streptomyces sp. NPDC085946 TaxID=3365744 RepID=UPI0037D41934
MSTPAHATGAHDGPTPLLVLDVVGLTPRLLDHMPHLKALGRSGSNKDGPSASEGLLILGLAEGHPLEPHLRLNGPDRLHHGQALRHGPGSRPGLRRLGIAAAFVDIEEKAVQETAQILTDLVARGGHQPAGFDRRHRPLVGGAIS